MRDPKSRVPRPDQTLDQYARALESEGHEEMFIRKCVATHFECDIGGFGAFFDDYPAARLGHITLLLEIAPKRTRYSLARKLSGNLGISLESAEDWVTRFYTAT